MERTTNMQLFGDRNSECGNIKHSFNTNITVNQTDHENDQIKHWLSPLDPRERHQSVQTNRVDGVGDWLLKTNEFREWSGSPGVPKETVLFCYGNPGAGKTHISSLVIDWLCDQVDRAVSVAALYCDYLVQEEQSTVNMLGAILKQLLERDGIPEPLRQCFRKGKGGVGGRAPRLSDLVKMLKTTVTSLPEVFICIDGLDECLPKNRQELLESLQNIVRASPTTRVFLSGRPHIRDEVKSYFAWTIMVSITPTIRDIERYLEMRLDKDTAPHAMDDSLRAEIMRVIPREISQIFLLSLNIDAVLEEVTISQRRKKLDEMIQGNGLQDAYSATLSRIRAQNGSKSRLGMEVLMWLSRSYRPLNTNELCQALGVEIGSTDLDPKNIPAIETVLGCSLGLVTVEASSYTVRLVHYTLQEYLSSNTDLFPNPHAMIAEVCLTYLNFQCIKDLTAIFDRPPPATPFLKYASCYWGTHAKMGITESVNRLALRLLDEFDKHISSKILCSGVFDYVHKKLRRSTPVGFTGLHGSAYFGIAETAVALLEMREWDPNATDLGGNTAILWAARKGHGAVVRTLLEREDIAPNIADQGGRTPLLWAAMEGFEGIVKMLLEREDTTPDTADKDGRTPLWWAAQSGHERIMRMLLKRENVTPDTADNEGRTPLSQAAGNGCEGIVKMLLERGDVIPDTKDNYGQTPLLCAAWDGSEGVVRMLLEREDVTPNTADKQGRNPLWRAAGSGHEGIVRILLERDDVAPDTVDMEGRTPLSWAAERGKESIVKILLKQADVTPDTCDKRGRTPLSWAAESGRGGVVKALLEREDVIPNTTDKNGRTPLLWAAGRGNEGIVRILLEREGVTPDIADEDGRTPLLWAAGNGCQGTVETLLERGDVTPTTADKNGRTPLLWAAGKGREGIVRMLLERGDATPNTRDDGGRTALSWAAGNGCESIVKMLLERQDVAPDTADKRGRTPLSWSAGNGHAGIIEALLERGDVTPDSADKNGQTPLSWARERGHVRLVEMLRERCNICEHILTTALAYQATSAGTSRKRHKRVAKRRLADQGSIPQSAICNSRIGHLQVAPSLSSQGPSKRSRRS